MDEIIRNIYSYIREKKELPEDLLYEFSQSTIRVVQSYSKEEITADFWKLQHFVEMFWRGRKFETEQNPVRIYQMGQLLSLTGMIRDVAEKAEKDVSIYEYARRWGKRYQVYKGMHDEPGINHKRLAEMAGLSVSSLSQMIAQTKHDGYFIYRIAGREKYYYLTHSGENLYNILKSRQRRLRNSALSGIGEESNIIGFTNYNTKINPAAIRNYTGNSQPYENIYCVIIDGNLNGRHCEAMPKKMIKEAQYVETRNSFGNY